MTVASFPRSFLVSRTPKISLTRLAVMRHRPISQLRSKILWMGKWRFKMKLRQLLDLGNGIETREGHLAAFFFGKLRPEDQGPVVELVADDGGTQPIGGGLESSHVIHRQESIVVLMEADVGAYQFSLDEGVAVEPVGGMERKETGYADNDRSQHLVANVEVVVGEAAALDCQNTVVGVLGGKLGHGDAEGAALFHAPEDEVDAKGIPPLHAV